VVGQNSVHTVNGANALLHVEEELINDPEQGDAITLLQAITDPTAQGLMKKFKVGIAIQISAQVRNFNIFCNTMQNVNEKKYTSVFKLFLFSSWWLV
jgi:hypothetical protein